MVILIPQLGLSAMGTILWGIGSSLGFPVAMSAAADNPRGSAARVSAVATLAYGAFLIGSSADRGNWLASWSFGSALGRGCHGGRVPPGIARCHTPHNDLCLD